MLPVYVGAYHRFIPLPQQAAGELHPGGMGLFRGSLCANPWLRDFLPRPLPGAIFPS